MWFTDKAVIQEEADVDNKDALTGIRIQSFEGEPIEVGVQRFNNQGDDEGGGQENDEPKKKSQTTSMAQQ